MRSCFSRTPMGMPKKVKHTHFPGNLSILPTNAMYEQAPDKASQEFSVALLEFSLGY